MLDNSGNAVNNNTVVGDNITFDASGKIIGGTVEQYTPDVIADGMELTKNEDGTFDVAKEGSVAKIESTYYDTLLDAVNSAQIGDTIEVLKDSTVESWKQTNTNFTGVTINGNNHKLTCSSFDGATLLNGMLACYGDCEINNLIIDLSALANPSGKRAIVASDGDVIDGVEIIGPGANTLFYGVYANGSSEDNELVTIKNCKFSGCNYAIGTEPYGGNGSITSNLEGLTVEKCEFTSCAYVGILYAKNTTFTGNKVDNGKLNIMHPETAVDGNTFTNGTRVQFFANPKSFVKNIFDGTSYLAADKEYDNSLKANVSENYWGSADGPSEYQIPENIKEFIIGDDIYYVDPSMDENDLNTYVPPYTVTIVYNNGAENEVSHHEFGDTITLPTPTNSAYIFLGWRSGDTTYKAGDKVYITSDTTFVAVWGNLPDVKPSAPETPETPVFPFYDVTARDWYYSAVKYVYEKGLMDGVDVGVFAPNDTLTRAMVWTIIARAEGVDTTGGATWYAKAQEWVTAKGISDGENPNAAITRQELVTMLYRLAGEPAVSGTITAPDAASVSTWATNAMTWAMNIGLVEGDENGAVTPTAIATRAQAAALIMRYLES